jgi:HEAT repeat protein
MREAATRALGALGHEQGTVVALCRVLEDESSDLRRIAAETLGEIGPGAEAAVPALIQALGDESAAVRRAAAAALEEIGPAAAEAVPALIQALTDEGYGVVSAALQALQSITGQDYGEDADRWQQWWEEQQ